MDALRIMGGPFTYVDVTDDYNIIAATYLDEGN